MKDDLEIDVLNWKIISLEMEKFRLEMKISNYEHRAELNKINQEFQDGLDKLKEGFCYEK